MMVMMLIAFKDLRERLRIFLGLAVVHIVRRVRAEHGRWRSTGMVVQADETPSRRFTLPYGIQRVYLARGCSCIFPPASPFMWRGNFPIQGIAHLIGFYPGKQLGSLKPTEGKPDQR